VCINSHDWRGVIIEESLSDLTLLNRVIIVGTVNRALEGGEDSSLRFHKVGVPESQLETLIQIARARIKSGWYIHLVNADVMKVIFSGRVFEIHAGDTDKFEEVRRYGMRQGIKEEQLGLEHLMDRPFD
jgi:hypothetical protein